jgi:hypothetical protein
MTDMLQQAIGNARKMELEQPRPLIRPLPPATVFPSHALGSILKPAADAIHHMTQAPFAICAQSVLAAATLCIQGLKDIQLPTGQVKPLSCFFLSVAATGERKSSCDLFALDPVRRHEEKMRAGYSQEHQDWLNRKDVHDKFRTDILRDKKNYRTADQKEAAIAELGPTPKAPWLPSMTCQEPTLEGLYLFMAKSLPSVGLFNGEGGQFIAGHGMNEESKIRTATGLSHFWDGTPVDRTRAADGYTLLAGKRLTIHLMAQPDIAATMLSDRSLLDQGLLSRFLVAAPDSAAGTRFFKERDHITQAAFDGYARHMTNILGHDLPINESEGDALKPQTLLFTEDARRLWIEFVNDIEIQLSPGGPLDHVRGLANKIPEHAARLGGVLAMAEDPQAWMLERPHLENGITLADYYLQEAIRLYSAGKTRYRLRLAQAALEWMQNDWPHNVISLPDLYQRGPNRIRDKDTALTVVGVLEDHGWLIEIPGGTTVNGQRRSEAWRIRKPSLDTPNG